MSDQPRFDRVQHTAPIRGRTSLAAAAAAGRFAQAHPPRQPASPLGPQIAQPQQIAGTPSAVGRAKA